MIEKFTKNEVDLLELLMSKKEEQVVNFLTSFMNYFYGENVIATSDYIIGLGDIPVVLIAHCDTVFEAGENRYDLVYDREKNIIASLYRGGFDDKAGILMIIKLIKEGYRPHILFTTQEEVGSLGCDKLIEDFPFCPWTDAKYFMQLDRRGSRDLITYDCENKQFDKYIERTSKYFKKNWGSFTDICTLMPEYEIAGCNLSVGYYNEHTRDEYLNVNDWFKSYRAVKILLSKAKDIKEPFEYIEDTSSYYNASYWYGDYPGYDDGWYYPPLKKDYDTCDICGGMYNAKSLIPLILTEGYYGYACPDCFSRVSEKCDVCNEFYEQLPRTPKGVARICPCCKGDKKNVGNQFNKGAI